MKKKIFIALTAASLFTATVCSADTTVEFDYDDLSINLVATGITPANAATTVSIAANDEELSFDNLPLYSSVFTANNEGTLNTNISLPEDIPGGKCYVYVNSASFSQMAQCIVINEKDPATIALISDVVDCKNADELYALLSDRSNALKFGTDIADTSDNVLYDACRVFMGELGNNEVPKAIDIQNALGKSLVYANIINGGDTDEAMKSYAATFGTTYEEYIAYSPEVRKAFAKIFKNAKTGTKVLNDIYTESMLLAQLSCCETWGECRSLTEENSDYIGIDIDAGSDFSDIKKSDRYLVFMDIFDERKSIDSIEEIKNIFDESVEDILKDQNKKPSGGGGGGGYGSASGSATVSGQYVQNIPVADEITQPVQKDVFTDISGHFSENAVLEMVQKGVINGYPDSTFRPDGYVSRCEIAKILCLALGTEIKQDVLFDDVSADSWYYSYVSALASHGYINGYNGLFMPDSPLTRQDMAVILTNILTASGKETKGEMPAYTDEAAIADYAKEAVSVMNTTGLMQGADSMFRPADSITRGEAATVVSRLMQLISAN